MLMKNEVRNFNNPFLKNKVKKILGYAKKQNLIKPHTLAFTKYPVQDEAHKGDKSIV